MKKSILALTFVLALTMFAAASSDGSSEYVKCKGCHGSDGSKAPLGVDSAIIKGQSKAEIANKLKGYKDDTYGGAKKSIMKSQSKRLSDDDIAALADYISKF
ncbi:cytochrome c class I [Denitrovibrio acetiphilus DSM 12809]|uniref:Cytochrome c class I n=1 Tax=Denitrovibrio acetiphilus (strain DSM 12809 / NBRC 114555 / N2460) TaxID=522772 RepID=D4H6S0_DENA2|nr:c-type cytochrome [Denitrovibrio acetiphilus]ADD67786.1 cytochrome c class I [Denitrovibrio acetiphilus DSM 12809]